MLIRSFLISAQGRGGDYTNNSNYEKKTPSL